MKWHIALILSCMLGCEKKAAIGGEPRHAAAPPTDVVKARSTPVTDGVQVQKKGAGMQAEAELQWNMSLVEAGKKLRIDYTVNNRGNERIYVCDSLLVTRNNKFARTPGRAIVMNGDSPGLVRFVLGAISADRPLMVIYNPAFKAVEPGQSHTAMIEVPYPLTAWHNLGPASPLRAPRSAVLQIHFFTGEPPWQELPGAEGPPISVPREYVAKILTTEPRALP